MLNACYICRVSVYVFETHWAFRHPLERVWEEIRQMDHWPEWWKYVDSVEILHPGGMDESGSVRRIYWKTALPYRIQFDSEITLLDFPHRMEGRTSGDLAGKGTWTFRRENGTTHVRYDWQVEIKKSWMKWLEPIARPVFRWNHDKVMAAGYSGLKKRLDHLHHGSSA